MGKIGPFGDADERVMGFVHVGAGKEDFVGGHQGQVHLVGQVQELRLGLFFLIQSVTHEFDVEASRKGLGQPPEKLFGGFALAIGQKPSDGPVRAAGQGDQAP